MIWSIYKQIVIFRVLFNPQVDTNINLHLNHHRERKFSHLTKKTPDHTEQQGLATINA